MSSNVIGADRHTRIYYATQNPVRVSPVAIKLPKYRPWREDIDNDLHHLISHGIDNVMNSRNQPQRRLEFSALEALNMSQMTTAFLMYLFGMVVSLLVFLAEKAQ